MTANGITTESKGCRLSQDLLPGISDHVVLDKVAPKLHWEDFFVLSSVSHAWYDAIRSRRVVDSRVLSRSSETVPAYYKDNSIALYSIRQNFWHKLPRITDTSVAENSWNPSGDSEGRAGIPALGQCVSVDGKIYVLGGVINNKISDEVFVFDLAGKGRWEQCASMGQRRKDFGSAVMDGKIYVFGGRAPAKSGFHPISCSEVYDTTENTWSRISSMITCRYGHHVTLVGEDLFIYRGWTKHIGGGAESSSRGHSLEAYHPSRDEWRVVHPSWNRPEQAFFFSIQGSIFSVIRDENIGSALLAIDKYDVHGNSWIQVHSWSLDALIPLKYLTVRSMPDAVLAVGDEVIALASCRERKGERRWRQCVFHSTGFFCSENETISWKLRAITFEQLQVIPRYFVQKL